MRSGKWRPTSSVWSPPGQYLNFPRKRLPRKQKKYDVGMSTQRDVLDFQDRLQKAMSNLALTESDYSRSVSNLARVKGILFEEKGLTM